MPSDLSNLLPQLGVGPDEGSPTILSSIFRLMPVCSFGNLRVKRNTLTGHARAESNYRLACHAGSTEYFQLH